MKIEFEFEINDWLEFQKHWMKNSKQFKRSKNIVASMVPVIFSVIIILDLLKGRINLVGMLIFGIVSLLWILFYPKRMESKALSKTKKMIEEGDNSGILGIHKISFNKEEILHTEPESENKILWKGVKKLEESDTHYFLFKTAISAIIIPKEKVLDSLEELDEILKNNIS